jgi:pyruvate-formate lyase-activating enzyme
MNVYDFANVLFGGPCNQRCAGCIGHLLDAGLTRDNLHEYPLRNQELFASLLRQYGVRQVVFTGTTTDPQLYDHEARLIDWMRRQAPGVQISLHTNGQLAMAKMEILNRYDRVTVSLPSFDRATFVRMTGAYHMPDLPGILRSARIPVKVSCLVSEENARQIAEFLVRCRGMGVRRVVIRRQYLEPSQGKGQTEPVVQAGQQPAPSPQAGKQMRASSQPQGQIGANLQEELRIAGCQPVSVYRGNPVYECGGMEVTCWDFAHSMSTSLNLFSDGTISAEYLLVRSQKIYSSFTPSPSTSGGKAVIMEPR